MNLEFQRIEANSRNKNLNIDKTKFYESNKKIKEFNKLDRLVTNDAYNLIANDIPKKRKCSLELRASKKRKKDIRGKKARKKEKKALLKQK